MKTGSLPCRRCHRLKATDITRCCEACNVELRAMEKRRPTAPAPAPVKNAIVFIEPNLD